MSNKLKFIFPALAIITLIGVGGCHLYPDGPERISDLDMVFTHYDTKMDFKPLITYSIVDAVYEVGADTTNGPTTVANSAYILSNIQSNMEALGYLKVFNTDTPDVRITVSAIEVTNTYYYYNYYYYYYYYWWGY